MLFRSKKTVVVNVGRKKRTTPQRKQVTAREVGLLGQALRSLGTAGGAAIGSYLGNPIVGGTVGNSLGATISRWLGAGDYAVASNTVVNRVLKGTDSIPMMHNNGQSVVVRHKEYIGEIRSATSFTLQNSLPLNPGMSGTFPWLSDIAVRFQEYRLKGMVFHYVPSSGTALSGTNPAIGTVMMQTSYRASDLPPTSKLEMLNEYCASESSPTEAFCHPIECDARENPFSTMYVRSGSIPTTDSMLMYDVGTTHIATTGNPATGNVLGDLWVTYEIELKKPVLASNVAAQIQLAVLQVNLGIGFTPIPSNVFGGQPSTIGNMVVTSDSANVLTFPRGCAGTYALSLIIRGAFTAADMSGAPVLTNCIQCGVIPGGGASLEKSVLTGAGSTLFLLNYYIVVYIADPLLTATVKMPTAASWTGTISTCYVAITQLETRTT